MKNLKDNTKIFSLKKKINYQEKSTWNKFLRYSKKSKEELENKVYRESNLRLVFEEKF